MSDKVHHLCSIWNAIKNVVVFKISVLFPVTVNFATFLLAYCCLLIAFGLAFSVLFSNYAAFKLPASLVKTVMMMSGELEYEDIFYNNKNNTHYPVTAHGMFLIFVLLVTVILTNLLVGLAVSDIQVSNRLGFHTCCFDNLIKDRHS